MTRLAIALSLLLTACTGPTQQRDLDACAEPCELRDGVWQTTRTAGWLSCVCGDWTKWTVGR